MKNILVTGNRGYIGSVLCDMLSLRGFLVTGLDTGYYGSQDLYPAKPVLRQIKKDIRDATPGDFLNVDAVIHLAALSNDPLGELRPGITEEINFAGTLKLAQAAKTAGVKRFIYASSQSMYGIADTSHELSEDEAGSYGVTAYARTKWDAEVELKKLASPDFIVVCFRPSTVFGASPNLRCDIVFNSMVASAYTTGKVEIKSSGTQWRPVVHVRDVSAAFIAGLLAPAELVNGESFNVGISGGNYTVKDIAFAAQRAVHGSALEFTGEYGSDERTYRVGFKKILTVLKDYYKPEWNLEKGGKELVDMFEKTNFKETQFRGRTCNRLAQIKYLTDSGALNKELRWQKKIT